MFQGVEISGELNKAFFTICHTDMNEQDTLITDVISISDDNQEKQFTFFQATFE
jgi:hypothetical protein